MTNIGLYFGNVQVLAIYIGSQYVTNVYVGDKMTWRIGE